MKKRSNGFWLFVCFTCFCMADLLATYKAKALPPMLLNYLLFISVFFGLGVIYFGYKYNKELSKK